MAIVYIVEGLPCSGKSTTAAFAAQVLRGDGSMVTNVDEGSGAHPADYEFHAFLSGELTECAPRLRPQIRAWGEPVLDGWVVPLSRFQGEDLQALLPYKLYDGLPWERERPVMLEKWKRFAGQAEKDRIYLFNCVLLQNPMCETMMRFDLPERESLAYIKEIAQTIAPLEPRVIYLKNEDIARRIEVTAQERPGWLEGFLDYHTSSAYGRRTHAHGFEGLVSCLEERQRRELSILQKLPVKSMVISNPHRDWEAAYGCISDFIRCGKA